MDHGLRLISQPNRRVNRQHMWKRPSEAVVSGLLGEDMLQAILTASMGHHIPIPISVMPQVKVHHGELYPTIQGAGFSSLSDLIAEATAGGKRQDFMFSKTGTTGAASFANSLWRVGNQPPAASAAAALAAGTHNDNTTAGGLPPSSLR